MGSQKRVLFLVENVPLELDSRVRREARTLIDAGFEATVICSGDRGQPRTEVVDGLRVYRYRRRDARSDHLVGHVVEYALALGAQVPLSLFVLLRHGFDVIHIANPPDLLWIVAAPYRLVGKRVIFDQHDLVPELFEVRFEGRFRWLSALVKATERISYRIADHVIATNETCRQIALDRGGIQPDAVTVVRNGPRLAIDFPSSSQIPWFGPAPR